MDIWKFFWLTRRYIEIDNPTSTSKIDQVVDALHLAPGATVLDIASGKAEMLCRIATRYGARCTGVDISEYITKEARTKVAERGLSELVSINQINGTNFEAEDDSFDVAMCIGATWVFHGLAGTLTQLARWVKPGGTVVVGEVFWAAEPPSAYLEAQGMSKDEYVSHEGNVGIGEAQGLTLVHSVVSNQDDWDRYGGLSWLAAYDFMVENPDDPDLTEIEARTVKDKENYLKSGRDCLGWAIYVFRTATVKEQAGVKL